VQRRVESIRESLAQTPGVLRTTFGLSMPLESTGGGRCCWSGRPNFAAGAGAAIECGSTGQR
jgi:hypothetical protein